MAVGLSFGTRRRLLKHMVVVLLLKHELLPIAVETSASVCLIPRCSVDEWSVWWIQLERADLVPMPKDSPTATATIVAGDPIGIDPGLPAFSTTHVF